MGRHGSGHVYKQSGAWHLQFYQNEKNAAGKLAKVRRLKKLIKTQVIGAKECDRCEKTSKASGVMWKGLYAGRRGACTAIIEATGGNYGVAQAVLRHKT